MSKFNMESLVSDIRKNFKDNPKLSKRIGVGSNLSKLEDKDYIILPEWWKACTGVPGLPFGKLVMIAGDSDSGKTSMAIEAMKAAQAQEVGIIYVETEEKTTEKDLMDWGVDPNGVLVIRATVSEVAFDLMFDTWDAFRKKYPDDKLLVIFDSFGSTIPQRDGIISLIDQSSKPGGKGAINKLALSKIVAKYSQEQTSVLLINYTYDNMGSPGKTNAGGKAVNRYSALTFQTSRKGWYERTEKGQKIRVGADVVWKLFKNHLDRSGSNKKEFTLRITSDGIAVVGAE